MKAKIDAKIQDDLVFVPPGWPGMGRGNWSTQISTVLFRFEGNGLTPLRPYPLYSSPEASLRPSKQNCNRLRLIGLRSVAA